MSLPLLFNVEALGGLPTEIVGAAIFLALVAGVSQIRKLRKEYQELENIVSGNLSGDFAIVSNTRYVLTGDTNDAGLPMYRQDTTVLEADFSIPEVFNSKVRGRITGYLKQAENKCSIGQSIVFNYLKNVISDTKKYEQAMKMINRQWRNAFEDLLTDTETTIRRRAMMKANVIEIKKPVLPILVANPALGKQEQVFTYILDGDVENPGSFFIPEEDQIVKDKKFDERVYNIDKMVRSYLQNADKREALLQTVIGIATGETTEIMIKNDYTKITTDLDAANENNWYAQPENQTKPNTFRLNS